MSKYTRRIYPKDNTVHVDETGHTYVEVDVYDVLDAFEVTNPATAHSVKKQLCPGIRGEKDIVQDLEESVLSTNRALDIERRKSAQPIKTKRK